MEKVELRNAKLMGGIGAILPLIGSLFVRRGYGLSFILGVASIILILMALNEISKKVQNPDIFSNYLTGFILQLINYFVMLIFVVVGGLALIFSFGTGFMGGLRGLGFRAILLLLVIYGLLIASNYFVKKSFDAVGDSLSNQHFKTAGMLLFIGAILTIVFGIGLIIVLIGEIFEIIGFFTLPDEIGGDVSKEPQG
ncbi:DUF996 domain-containing protein [Caldisericum exile]|uniref:Hypothetical membrane protein n=1 Tax=Caldisericum exile (strain DSM 21853 / NBRC 104410 / AZM16c01) TaxID=511051 RepID=A0A7U6GFM9_CALEA|nr:DUF996 domain-containing protein [Caldisericum exile]BAL81525.1 hypothetical membrane protein [Caldisericum exile AZM16c01]